ncbi:MAG: type II secretion system F family protein [bacterium]
MTAHVALLTAGVFLAVLIAGLGLSRVATNGEAKRLRDRLRDMGRAKPGAEPAGPDLLKDQKLSTIPAFDALLRRLPLARSLHLLLLQGATPMRVGSFLLLTAVLAVAGVAAATMAFHAPLLGVPAALAAAALPFAWIWHRKTKRVQRFERQFPDALEILTGALRSGLALTGAIQVVAEECSDPVSTEFTILFEQTRLGVDMRDALRSMADRVDSKELRLFVIAVLLQRETGGNLAEVLDGAAQVIRERLRILGDVRALTAQARLSAGILSLLPVSLAVFILATAPDYLRVLIRESAGRWMLASAAGMQLLGFLIMRRIAKIKV